MRSYFAIAFAVALFGSSSAGFAQQDRASKYVGQENREIKSLSPEDIAELRRGGGWGLARAAELNGVPGPAHILEFRDEIPLSEEQADAVAAIFDDMNSKAIAQGEKLIALERQLDRHFSDKTITESILRSVLADIAEARGELRYIHLSTHLKTPSILSVTQIERYNALRGYSRNPCANVPAGHDSHAWRKNNGCG